MEAHYKTRASRGKSLFVESAGEQEQEPRDEEEDNVLSFDQIIDCVLHVKERPLQSVGPILTMFYHALDTVIAEPHQFDEMIALGVHDIFIELFQTVPTMRLLSLVIEIIYKWSRMSGDLAPWMQKDLILPVILLSSKKADNCSSKMVLTMMRFLLLVMHANKNVFKDFDLQPESVLEGYVVIFHSNPDTELRKWAGNVIEAMLGNETTHWELQQLQIFKPIFENFVNSVELPEFTDLVNSVFAFVGHGPDFADTFVSFVPIQVLFDLLVTAPETSFASIVVLINRLICVASPLVVSQMQGFVWDWAREVFAVMGPKTTEHVALLLSNIFSNVPMAVQCDGAQWILDRVILESVTGEYQKKEMWIMCLCTAVQRASPEILDCMWANGVVQELTEFLFARPMVKIMRAIVTFYDFGIQTGKDEIVQVIKESGCIDEIQRVAESDEVSSDEARVIIERFRETDAEK